MPIKKHTFYTPQSVELYATVANIYKKMRRINKFASNIEFLVILLFYSAISHADTTLR